MKTLNDVAASVRVLEDMDSLAMDMSVSMFSNSVLVDYVVLLKNMRAEMAVLMIGE
jgi:hypothetical protein